MRMTGSASSHFTSQSDESASLRSHAWRGMLGFFTPTYAA